MFKKLAFIATLIICFVASTAQAKSVLRIGVGNFPPFFVEENQSGLFLDITKSIFQNLPEYEVKFVFMSNSRLQQEINHGKRIDVACNIFKNSNVNAFLSDPLFRYTDVAVTHKSKNIKINNVGDLTDLSVAAYQGATDLLGYAFKEMAKANANYSEHPHPKDTTHLLVTGKKDVRVGDINIFYHDLGQKPYQSATQNNIDDYSIYYLWPVVYSHMAFKNKGLRDAVNQQIRKLTHDGTFDQIYRKYKQATLTHH